MNNLLKDISELIDSVDYRVQLISRNQRLIAGIENTRFKGMLIGIIFTLLVVGLPILYYKGGF
ncbi:tetrahydromethanopterin S-methyltransferase subunit F [Methanosphaera sp.]